MSFNEPYVGNPATIPLTEAQFMEAYVESGRQIIEQAKQQVEDVGVTLQSNAIYNLVTEASPAEYAVWYAKENNIDLIVVGCAGHHSRIKTALMGTVATNITNNASCPVLVVR